MLNSITMKMMESRLLYSDNQYSKISVTVRNGKNRSNIQFKPYLVDNNKQHIKRKLVLILHQANKPELIKLNNQILKNWKFDKDQKLITIELQYLLKESLEFVI